jgi:sensor histidine kinase regulating citrate/malate metabolism
LENAIEAARQTEEKYLYVSMTLRMGVLKIKVENSFPGADRIDTKLEDNKVIWKTTKKEKEQHGIGLKNVRKIVELYDGTMETKVDNNMFCVNLVLYMMQSENEV